MPPLPPELREDIKSGVASDVRRIGIGSAMVLAFIPIFIMMLIAKFFIDRSRRAQAFAEQKKQEAKHGERKVEQVCNLFRPMNRLKGSWSVMQTFLSARASQERMLTQGRQECLPHTLCARVCSTFREGFTAGGFPLTRRA